MTLQFQPNKLPRTASLMLITAGLVAGLSACGGGGSPSSASNSGGGTTGGGGGTTTPACGTATGNAGNIVLAATSCPAGTQGTAYAGCQVAASGGTPPYNYCVSTDTTYAPLPEGLTLNITTGQISSPAVVGGQGYYVTKIIVTDSAKPNNMATQTINFSLAGNNAFMASIFPSNSIFHHRVDAASTSLPVDTSQAAPMQCTISGTTSVANCASTTIKPFFGNKFGGNFPFGVPAISVPSTQAMVAVNPAPGAFQSYFTTAPIPAYAPVETTSYSTGDRHVIVYQQGSQPALYELYQGILNSNGSWTDTSNALWTNVSTSNALTPIGPGGKSGTTLASGLPDAATLVNADEVVVAGVIQHPIRVVLLNTLNNMVWPATTSTGSKVANCTGVTALSMISQSAPPTSCSMSGPFGEIYRLKASVTPPTCLTTSPQSAVIYTALQNYGIILGDNGYDGGLLGTPDSRWNDYDLACLSHLHVSDFEPVNVSSLMISNTSGQTSH